MIKKGPPCATHKDLRSLNVTFSTGTVYGSVEVTLHKQKHASLGITVSGGVDRGYPPRITTIIPGSIADKWVF